MHHWIIIALSLFAFYKIYRFFHLRSLLKKFNAKPYTNYRNNGPFGLSFALEISKTRKQGTFPSHVYKLFNETKNPKVKTISMSVMGKPTTLTADPENIKAILATQFNEFGTGQRFNILSPLLGKGIFTSSGDHWKFSRALLRPQFAREKVGHVQSLEPHFKLLKKHILNTKGKEFDIQYLFSLFTIDAATEFLFGQSVHSLKDESIGEVSPDDSDGSKSFTPSLAIAQEYMSQRALLQHFHWLISPPAFHRAIKVCHDFADHYVKLAIRNAEKEKALKVEANDESYVLLYEMVKSSKDPIMIRDQLFNLLIAGRNTTSNFLGFIFFELARNQPVWEKLKAEVRQKFGDAEDTVLEDITFESLKNCDYLRAVLNETLRLYPLVPLNMRVPLKDTSLPRGGGEDGQSPVVLEKGSITLFSSYTLHRCKEVYGEDADEWRPERWFEPGVKSLGWNYMPFLGGPRICIGQQFALTETSYVVTRLCQEFDNLDGFDKQYPPKIKPHIAISLQEGSNIALY